MTLPVTPEEFVRMIVDTNPIEPMDDWNECRFCGSAWAEETYELWLARQASGQISDHHDEDCIWVLAHQIEAVA